jgi:hypothetical protein
MITKIEFVERVDNSPNTDYGYEGASWTDFMVYRLVSDSEATPDQFIKIAIECNSYGEVQGVGAPTLVKVKTKTVNVWE